MSDIPGIERRTKIVCTIGPATSSPAQLRALLERGMNVARLNFSHGEPAEHEEAEANATLAAGEVRIAVRLDEGDVSAVAWGCDLTYEYVRINGSYRT